MIKHNCKWCGFYTNDFFCNEIHRKQYENFREGFEAEIKSFRERTRFDFSPDDVKTFQRIRDYLSGIKKWSKKTKTVIVKTLKKSYITQTLK